MWLKALENLRLRHRADDLVDRLTVLVNDHGRDVEDAELRSVLLILIDVDLDDLHAVGFLRGDLLKDGANHLAGTAPRRPEINENGLVGFNDFGLIGGISCVDWLGHVYLQMAKTRHQYFHNDTMEGLPTVLDVSPHHDTSFAMLMTNSPWDSLSIPASGRLLNVAFDVGFLALPPSGIGSYVEDLIGALSQRDDMVIRALSPSGPMRRLGDRELRMAWDSGGVEFARMRHARGADLLHVPAFSAPLWTGVPLVVTIHDVIPFVLPEYRSSRAMRVYLQVMRRTVRRARMVLTPSWAAAEGISRVLGVPDDRIRVTPLAADPDLCPPEDVDDVRSELADQFGILGRYFLHIAGFDRRKNVPLLVQAFARALPQLPDDMMLLLAGAPHTDNPVVYPPVEPVIKAEGIETRVILTGRVSVPQRRLLYQGAYGYVTPSIHEGFGLTPLEAMATGVPVIAANRTSLPEVVGDAGMLVEPNVEAVAGGMIRLGSDASLHGELARRGRERSKAFTWERTARLTAEAYHESVGG